MRHSTLTPVPSYREVVEVINNSKTIREAAEKLGMSEIELLEVIASLYLAGRIRGFRFK
ncbi:MAG: hypothetical protein XD40_0727 [Archaeoglobus fulgidus]|jgi:hypothetical protein|uniref:Uncharacterized protein n=1 Tax=Archaeoglobus fulgidus TaxID=2234 RepID=A0A101DEP8_ARCFL|nr:hypothetical protein [Archaeoglobus fulgidus]KUJ94133.1 MAG: hypothetical protein XD40_0727 [Archaeoglobus fulgidus]KUK07723.1 MAG: hypothetical protein XD48_0058 [Archaeoglobus fulgidus]